MAFKTATDAKTQREQFKNNYAACVAQIKTAPSKDIQYHIVPSLENSKKNGPTQALIKMINSAKKNIRVAIHRFTTSTLASPIINKAKQGIPVSMIQDDDTLRKGVVEGGPAADVGGDDVGIMRRNIDAGVDMNFMQTNASTTVHMFHSKYVIVDEKSFLQIASNVHCTHQAIARAQCENA